MATLDQSLVKANSNFTAIYIGIATYDDESIDQLIYSSDKVMTHFARGIRMCSWFSTLMVNMKNTGVSPYTYETLKAADFLLSTWLRVKFPEVKLNQAPIAGSVYNTATWGPLTRQLSTGQYLTMPTSTPGAINADQLNSATAGRAFQVAWTCNPGHNIIDNAKLYVNDVPIETLDNTWLDLISQFRISAGKIEQYQAMIGNTPAAVGWTTSGFAGAVGISIPSYEVDVPLPFFYDRDSSTSFPLCGVTLNKVEIRVELRDLQHLIRCRIETYLPAQANLQGGGAGLATISGKPIFLEVPMRNSNKNADLNNFISNVNDLSINSSAFNTPQLWSRYAVVTKKERNAHSARGCKRDLLIEYVQKSDNSNDEVKQGSNTTSSENSNQKYEFIFNNPVRALMFVAENVTAVNVYNNFSNYSNNVEVAGVGKDYLKEVSFRVDNTVDMYTNVPAVFFTHCDPFYVANRIPNKPGYHALFYCLDLNSLEADGSWNYNKVKGYITYTYEKPEGYLATGVYADPKVVETVSINFNSLTAQVANEGTTVNYTSYVYGTGSNNLQARLRIRALAWNIIRIQDNVLGAGSTTWVAEKFIPYIECY